MAVDKEEALGDKAEAKKAVEVENAKFDEAFASLWIKEKLNKVFECDEAKYNVISASEKFAFLSKLFEMALVHEFYQEIQKAIFAEMESHALEWITERQLVLMETNDVKLIHEMPKINPREQYEFWEKILEDLEVLGLKKAIANLELRMEDIWLDAKICVFSECKEVKDFEALPIPIKIQAFKKVLELATELEKPEKVISIKMKLVSLEAQLLNQAYQVPNLELNNEGRDPLPIVFLEAAPGGVARGRQAGAHMPSGGGKKRDPHWIPPASIR